MTRFTFDVKAFVTLHVEAPDEEAARAVIDNVVTDLLEGGQWEGDLRPDDTCDTVFINSASLDGEHELMEVDGEAPDAD